MPQGSSAHRRDWRNAATITSQALGDAICKVIGGDTECPLQVCQLSRSSESTHFVCLRRDVALPDSTRVPDDF